MPFYPPIPPGPQVTLYPAPLGPVWTDDGLALTVYELGPGTDVLGLASRFTALVKTSVGIRIYAIGSDVIRIGNSVTEPGGYIESLLPGSCVDLIAVGGGWTALSHPGLWALKGNTP